MNEIPNPHRFYLIAAQGWLELGNPAEAKLELDRMDLDYKDHPDVLETAWAIEAKAMDWAGAAAIASRLVETAPDRATAWLHLSYSVRRCRSDGLAEAYNLLRQVYNRFTEEPTIPYNLACYAAVMKRFEESLNWLRLACRRGNRELILKMAAGDEDLVEIRPFLKQIRAYGEPT